MASERAANFRERIYASHPFGMPPKFARASMNDRRQSKLAHHEVMPPPLPSVRNDT